MTSTDDNFASHRQAWELIPWVVNYTATEAERTLLRTHLTSCTDCAAEYALQSRLHEAMQAGDEALGDRKAAFATLEERLDAPPAAAEPPRRRFAGGSARVLVAVVVLEAVSILALSGALWLHGTGQNALIYRTLGAGEQRPARASIRAVLDPAVTLGQLQALLAEYRLQIAAGPSEAGVYTLAPHDRETASDTLQIVAGLRSHPGVHFAEPIEVSASSP